MSKLVCKCPSCNTSLQLDSGEKKLLKVQCPKCQHSFQIRVTEGPSSADAAKTTKPVAKSKKSEGDVFHASGNNPLNDILPDIPPVTEFRNPATYHGQFRSKRKSSLSLKTWLLPIAVTAGAIAGLGLIVLVAKWGIQFLPEGSNLSELSSSISLGLSGSDSREKVEEDHANLRAEIEKLALSIPDGDQSEETAQRIRAELPKFHALFLRACKLPTESKSMQDYVAAKEASRAMLENLRNQNMSATSAPAVSPFWHVRVGPPADEFVTHARNEITLASASVPSTLMAHLDYPDPMTFDGQEFDWTDDDRQVLAFIHLQGCMQRDSLRALATIDPKNPIAKDLTTVHRTIDRYVALAKVVRKVPRKTSSLIAFVPKDNPYESLEKASWLSLTELRKHFTAQAALPVEVEFLFQEIEEFRTVCEGLMFGFQSRQPAMLTTSSTSSDRLKAFLAAEEKKKEDQRKEEIARQEKEMQRLAEEAQRRQLAESQQKEREEKRQRELQERLANPSSGLGGSRPGGFGPRPGARGIPTGPNGENAAPGFPPNYLGSDSGSPRSPMDRGPQPSPSPLNSPKMVTITANSVKNTNSSDYTRDLPKWLLQHSVSVLVSNGNLKITLQDYDKPLAELESCFPMLVFDQINESTRTIIAKEK